MRTKLKQINPVNFIFLTVAGVVNAAAVTLFLQPAMLYDGGFSGTSILLSNLSGWSVSIFLLILNFPFFIFGYKKLGLNFIVYSLYAIALFSLFSYLFQNCFGIDYSDGSPITKNEKLLAAVFGGIISGIGSGITIRFGGAIDGVEVLSLIFAKRIGMTVGTFVMSYNLILYILAGIITSSWITPLYSIIAYALGLKSVDFIIEGFDKSKSAFIISNHPEKIADTLVDIFERGVTIINAEGYYSKMPKKVLYCVVNRFEVNTLKKIVTGIDPKAFVAITDVSDSMGSSLKFDKLRERKRRKRKNNSPAPIVKTVEKVTIPEEILENLDSVQTENAIVSQDSAPAIEQSNNAIAQNVNLQIEQSPENEQKVIESQVASTIDEKAE
ncbi:MAG: YitT family protein [Clostridia bacterium]|nr:YitT family protein [Clostridia bacterium]